MLIDPKRSKFKKSTEKYFKEGIFDIIDIEEALSKNRYIEKIDPTLFLYQNYEIENRKFKKRKSTEDKKFYDDILFNIHKIKINEIYEKINKNKFSIKIEEIMLEYDNGYMIKLVERYIPLDLIGEGGFGIVISAYDKTKKMNIAIKIISKFFFNSAQIENCLNQESSIHSKIDHPNVLKLYEVLDNNEYKFMFMELIEGGSLKDLIIHRYTKKENYLFQDSECALIMKGILNGVDYLHSMNIMHRDIKPENIMFKDLNDLTSLKIADFGLATVIKDKENFKCGTVIYMAPEIIDKKYYDQSIDIWACGYLLYILCSGGKHPIFINNMGIDNYINELKKQEEWTFTSSFSL